VTSVLVCMLMQLTIPEAAAEVKLQFEVSGREVPSLDALMSAAAQSLATQSVTMGIEKVTSLPMVTAAMSEAGAWDTNLVTVALRASPKEIQKTIREQQFAKSAQNQMGIGGCESNGSVFVVILLANRKLTLNAVPRRVAPGKSLYALIASPIVKTGDIQLFITAPDGTILKKELEKRKTNFTTGISFSQNGKHTVELVVKTPTGPDLGALFFVQVGAPANQTKEAEVMEPKTSAEAKVQILAKTNALRLALGARAISFDSTLETVAQKYAEQMNEEGFFAHVDREGHDLRFRLKQVNYAFDSAGENLGLSSGAMAAHFGIEHSPGHRTNLVNAVFTHVGIGILQKADGQVIVVEAFAQRVNASSDPKTRAKESLISLRKELKLTPLHFNAALENLAQLHAQNKASGALSNSIEETVFAQLPELTGVSVDVFKGDQPTVLVSKSLKNPQYTQVGIGLAQDGKHQWIVVAIFGSTEQ
jgi:uncharacterized protein YkwD